MKARTMRCAMALGANAAARIRAAGRVPPDEAELTAALLPSARHVIRSYRWADRMAAEYQRARDCADGATQAAEAAVARIAAAWLEHAPEPGSTAAEFDAIASQLSDIDRPAGDAP